MRLLKNIRILLLISFMLSMCLTLIISSKMFISELGRYKQHSRNIWWDMVCTQEISLCHTRSISILVWPNKNENIDPSIGFSIRILSEHYDYKKFFPLNDMVNGQWNLITIHDEEMEKVRGYATVYIESVGMTEENYIMLNFGEDLSTINYATYIMGESQGYDNLHLKYDRFSFVSFCGMELSITLVIFLVLYKWKSKREQKMHI